MDARATGIILRTYPFRETSLIVRWLTREEGRLDTVARGARRPTSPFCGKLDLFYLADLSFARSRRSDLHNLREVSLRDTAEAMRTDLQCLRQAAYAVALITQATEPGTPVPEIFDLLHALLPRLGQVNPTLVLPAFELRLLAALGQEPRWDETRLSPNARRFGQHLLSCDWSDLAAVGSSAQNRAELERFLHGFLIDQLGRLPPRPTHGPQASPGSASECHPGTCGP
jgi:DNA repair protein RecO (recombination protein O)